jgi:glycosyltransferase involved in cell wall biosynthesis
VLCGNEIRTCVNYITVSEYIQKTYLERYRGIRSRFYVLKNAVNTGLFGQELSKETFTAERNKYGLAADDIIVLFTGRISEEKGIVELANAFLHIDDPKLKLLIAGSGFFDTDIKTPLQGRLEQILKPVIGRVVFTGYVKYTEIWKLYKIADMGCFPSVWNDPAPLIVIEAMAAGLPFITTNSGGIPEYARRACAFILERDDALTAHIKQAIEILSQDAVLRKKMGEKGKEIGAEYNLDNYYRNFLAIVS